VKPWPFLRKSNSFQKSGHQRIEMNGSPTKKEKKTSPNPYIYEKTRITARQGGGKKIPKDDDTAQRKTTYHPQDGHEPGGER